MTLKIKFGEFCWIGNSLRAVGINAMRSPTGPSTPK